MLKKLHLTSGDPIPLIWYFNYDVFETSATNPTIKSANIIGQICMLNFKTSGAMYLYQDEDISYKNVEDSLKDVESSFKRYIILIISVTNDLPDKSLLIKTSKGKNFELIENLSRSLFTDINQLEFEFSDIEALLNEDKYIEIELSLSKVTILDGLSKENTEESKLQNSIRMLVYTLFGALSCR